MTPKYYSVWDGHLSKITVAKQSTVLNPPYAPLILSALYCAGPKQQEPELEEVAQMKKDGVAEPAIAEWALVIVLAPEKCEDLRFCVEYRRLNVVKVRDSYPIRRMDERIRFPRRSKDHLVVTCQL